MSDYSLRDAVATLFGFGVLSICTECHHAACQLFAEPGADSYHFGSSSAVVLLAVPLVFFGSFMYPLGLV